MKYKFTIISLLLLAIMACEKTVNNLDLPDEGTKQVLSCFIAPGSDTVYARLSRSTPFFDEEGSINQKEDLIKHADIRISHNEQEVKMIYDDLINKYYYKVSDSLEFEHGEVYHITSEAAGYDKVSGSTEIPRQLFIPVSVSASDSLPGHVTLNFEFPDLNPGPDYYRLVLFNVHIEQNDTLFENTDLLYDRRSFFMLKDQGYKADGHHAAIEVTDFSGTKHFRLVLLHVDINYYNFHMKLKEFESSNPFIEPSIRFTNIENGLGVFASYTKTVKDFSITVD